MSEAEFAGLDPAVRISRRGQVGMVTLRGDLAVAEARGRGRGGDRLRDARSGAGWSFPEIGASPGCRPTS